MTEVKNNSLDLMNMQLASSRKKNTGGNTSDDLMGFKTMLRDKNQRPDNETMKAPDKKKDDSEPAAEAAAAAMTKPEPRARENVSDEPETVQGLETEPVQPDKGLQIIAGLWEEGQTGSQFKTENHFQTLEHLRFQQLLGVQNGIQDMAEAQVPEVVSENAREKLPIGEIADNQTASLSGESSHLEEMSQLENGVQFEVRKEQPEEQPEEQLSHTAVSDEKSGKEHNSLETGGAVEPRTPVKPLDTYEEPAEQTEKISAFGVHEEQKNAFSGKEEKLPEESAAALQEKPYEQPLNRVQPGEEQTAYTTVKAENQEDLEAKLSEQLLRQIQTGRKELEVQLEPVNLGKIRIKVSYEDNQVSVSVLCTESKTLKALSQSAGDLGSILESNLERPVQILVDKQESDYLNNQQQQQEGRQQEGRQQQQSRDGEDNSDFLQKLRLGILDADAAQASYSDYR